MKLPAPVLLLAVLALSACGIDAGTKAAAGLPLAFATAPQPAPAPTDHTTAQALLQPLAQAAPLPGGAPWLYWEGAVPADVQAEAVALDEFQRAYGLESREWEGFADGLHQVFEDVRVYVLPEKCHNCTKTLFIIEGKAAWGPGGFLGHTFRDH